MTPEETAEQQAQDEASALAEFESGFTGKPTESKAPDDAEKETEKAEPTAEGDDPVADPTEKPGDETKTEEEPEHPTAPSATITPEQFQTLLEAANSIGDIRSAVEKLRGDAFGRMGGLERTLKTLQDTTPSGQAIELTSEDLAELEKEYPEMTENLVRGLSRAFKRFKGTATEPALKIEDVDQRVVERATVIAQEVITRESARIREEIGGRMLDAQHEGWRDLVGPKDSDTPYRRWLKSQGKDYEKKMLESDNPVEIGKSLTQFKETLKKPSKKPSGPVHDRQQRLAEAVLPRGGNKPPLPKPKTPEEEFAEGFEYQAATR